MKLGRKGGTRAKDKLQKNELALCPLRFEKVKTINFRHLLFNNVEYEEKWIISLGG